KVPFGSAIVATPHASVDEAYRPTRTSTSLTGVPVVFSTILTVTACSGALSIRKLNVTGVPSWRRCLCAPPRATERRETPSVAGADSSIAVQYSASVPAQGASPSVPAAAFVAVSSRTSTTCPDSLHAAVQRTPTFTWNELAD